MRGHRTIIIPLFLTIVFTGIQFSVTAQTSTGKGISAEEKRALEKRFQGLNTFYIDDDGAVVYLQQDAAADSVAQPVQQAEAAASYAKTKIKVYINEWGEYVVSSEEVAPEQYHEQGVPTEGDGTSATTETSFAQEETLASEEMQEDVEPEEFASEETTDVEQSELPITSSTDENVSVYQSLEMAMADVDQLLEELKKTQKSKNGKKSLSERVASGVDGSLRERTFDFDEAEPEQDESIISEEQPEDNGNPTYYINGALATNNEVKKLKTGDILKKVIKTSKTNPNGEWWIETRKK